MDRELLLKVYDAALEEYRFNVSLSWDRTKFFLLLNSGLVTAGVGLIRVATGGDWLVWLFLIFFFLVAVGVSFFGLETVEMGKEYYREAVFTKTLVERQLGLLEPVEPSDEGGRVRNLSIAVTKGMRNADKILAARASSSKVFWQSVAGRARGIFYILIAIELMGSVASAVSMMLSLAAKAS